MSVEKTVRQLQSCSLENCRQNCPMRWEEQVDQDLYRVRCAAWDAAELIHTLLLGSAQMCDKISALAACVESMLTPEDALLRVEEVYAMSDEERAEVYAALTSKKANIAFINKDPDWSCADAERRPDDGDD